MVRIVRSPDGIVDLDKSGKANGRGGYLCKHFICWQRALRKRGSVLKYALKADLDLNTINKLKWFGKRYKPQEETPRPCGATEAENQVESDGTPDAETQADSVSDAETQADSTSDEQATAQKEKPAKKKEESS